MKSHWIRLAKNRLYSSRHQGFSARMMTQNFFAEMAVSPARKQIRSSGATGRKMVRIRNQRNPFFCVQ